MLPPETATLLRAGGDWHWPGSTDHPCAGAKFHSPTPLFTHEVRLVPMQWWINAGANPLEKSTPIAWLCATCKDNLNLLHQIIYRGNGEVPWSVRREFGNELRRLAFQGWAHFKRVTGHA